MEEVIIKSYKEAYPNVYGFKTTCENPKSVILFVHGMAEHIGRYKAIANYLSSKGFICYGFDLIGHGKSVFENERVGIVKADDFFTAEIECIKHIYDFIKLENKDLEINLFAHSMGSMISQCYLEKYPNDFSKVILSGTDLGTFKYKLMSFIAKGMIKKHGLYYYSDLIQKLSLDSFDKPFDKKLGWLSVNEQNIKDYLNDPLCNERYPIGYFYSFAVNLYEASKTKNIKNIKAKKILFLTGEKDPVTNFSKSTKKIYKKYQKLGLNCYIEILPGLRHEVFHESDDINLAVYQMVDKFYS
ncbi:MAG: alpha/beta fold hydrolase [Bacilli bacterium]|nr:alpha/beta fold hydrolase [Bacilli bacterium]